MKTLCHLVCAYVLIIQLSACREKVPARSFTQNITINAQHLKEVIPLEERRGTLYAKGKVNGIDGWLLIDTGAANININQCTVTGPVFKDSTPSFTATGHVQLDVLDGAAKINLGGSVIDVTHPYVQPDADVGGGEKQIGIIGSQFLKSMKARIDYRTMQLHLHAR